MQNGVEVVPHVPNRLRALNRRSFLLAHSVNDVGFVLDLCQIVIVA